MSDVFENDSKDRKRRFLRGLNRLLGVDYYHLEDKDTALKDALNIMACGGILGLRDNLANVYCLEFTTKELVELLRNGMTTGEFTEKYCPIIYKDREKVDLNTLINTSMSNGAIDPLEMDKAPKYGLNGSQWCDVAESPCSCGAWH